MTLSQYVDANLMHDVATGRSVTGILHLVNKTPIEWYSKKQDTVEKATYGSEFVASHVYVWNRSLVYEIHVNTWVCLSETNAACLEAASLWLNTQCNSMPSYISSIPCCQFTMSDVRETIASGFLRFYFLPGDDNPADILSQH
jgi:hypothetical protein